MFRKPGYLFLVAFMAVLMSSCKVLRKDRAKAVQLPEVSLAENVAQAVADSLNAMPDVKTADVQQKEEPARPADDNLAAVADAMTRPQPAAADAKPVAEPAQPAPATNKAAGKVKDKGRHPSGTDPTATASPSRPGVAAPASGPAPAASPAKPDSGPTTADKSPDNNQTETNADAVAPDTQKTEAEDAALKQKNAKTVDELFGPNDEQEKEPINEHPFIMALLIIALILLALALLGYHFYMRRAIADVQKSGDDALMELRMQHQREREMERLAQSRAAVSQPNVEKELADLQQEKEAAIQAKEAALTEMKMAVSEKDAALSEKNAAISEKETVLSEKEALLTEMQTTRSEKDAAITEKNEALSAKEAALSGLKTAISEKEKAEKEKAEAIQAQQDAIAAKQKAEGDRDAALAKLAETNAQLAEQADALHAKDAALAKKDADLASKDAELSQAVAELASVKNAAAAPVQPVQPVAEQTPEPPAAVSVADSEDHTDEIRTMRKILIGKMELARTLLDMKGEKKGEIISVDEWKDIELFLEKVDNHFVSRFAAKYPSLTKKDLQLMMLLRLKVPSKNIAAIYGINEKSVKQKLFIYKAKVGMENDSASLRDYIETF